MVSKLSQNGVGCLLLANGALSGDGFEAEIRQQLIENDLVEAIIVLPRNMFYSTDISVTIWVFNKNKHARVENKNGRDISYRDRTGEVLFLDLRQKGHPYEKKYIELTPEDRKEITDVYHNWQSVDKEEKYSNIKEFCYSATKEEIAQKGYSLVTSKYIEFDRDTEEVDYSTEMTKIQGELQSLFEEESKSRAELAKVLEELGYGIKL